MVRVAGLKGQQLQGVEERSADGLKPVHQLAAIGVKADELMARQQEIWAQLKQEQAEAEFHVLDASDLGDEDTAWLQDHVNEQIFQLQTPQANDPEHPFPLLPTKVYGLVFDPKHEKPPVGEKGGKYGKIL